MPASFSIRYFDPTRATVVEEVASADSEAALRARWAAAGHVLLEVRAAPSTGKQWSRGESFSVAWWCRELRTLLLAGMTVVEALETLHAQSLGDERAPVHAALLRSLREGQSLSRAMQGAGVFPQVLVASVTASERTSTLTTALEDFLRYDEMLGRLKRMAISAAIYPAVVVSLGALISLFLLLYVIPRFSNMYVGFRGAVSVPTQILMLMSAALRDHLPIVLAVLAAVGLLGLWGWRSGRVARGTGALIERVAPLQRQWEHFRRAKLYQSLALMFKGGYTLDEALAVCEGLGLGTRTGHGIARARRELARGRSVAAAFAQAGLTDTVSERLLAVGERTGGFDAVLQTIADRHAQTFATFVERATRIVEPVLLLVVALVVGGIVVMMYMPIFDIANGIR
jgi:general secretion pathway protein F